MCFGSYNESSMPMLKWEQEVFHVRIRQSRIQGGKMGLFAAADIPKTGMHALCLPAPVWVGLSSCFSFMVLPALIAFCWGRFRVTAGGPAEDLFNPVYEGCFDRIVKLHR